MTRIRKLIQAEITDLGDDEVEVVMSTAILARDGDVLLPQGCRLKNYTANPIVLWSHNANMPVGNVTDITVEADQIRARVRFAPLGISTDADRTRGLVKAGVIRTVSVGFDPVDGEPLDPKKPRGGMRFTDWELLELSFCSVPVDTGAVVTARQYGDDPTMSETPTTPAAPTAPQNRAITTATNRTAKVAFTRGIYDIGELCCLFSRLGWQVDEAKWEAALEGDNSPLPGMLAGILHDLGDAIIAMTVEEIGEALAKYDLDPEIEADTGMDSETRAHVRAAATPALRAFRYGMAAPLIRAGKTLSNETARCLREAKAIHEEAIAMNRSATAKHKAGLAAIDDMLERATSTDTPADTAPEQANEGDDDTTEGARALSLSFRQRQVALLELGIEP